jgi:glycosyltransferase involved in cell wall biosynthesis
VSGRRRVVHLLSGFAEGDAISSESRAFARIFDALGFDSVFHAADDRISPGLRGACAPLSQYRPAPGDIAFHQYGIDSPAAAAFLSAPPPRILRYQNITPSRFFRGYDDALADRLDRARARLADVAGAADAVWAASDFNAAEARAAGADRVRTLPLLFAADNVDAAPDPSTLEWLDGRIANWLFVGRIAPNKAVEELVAAFAWYRQSMGRKGRLIVVGSRHSCPSYYAMLRMYADELGLDNVYFTGFLSPGRLAHVYGRASVFVCASRHEGYCLPLLEAMAHGVPVAARAAGGTPEAMGAAGIRFEEATAAELASLADLVATDAALRDRVLASQRARLEELRRRRPEDEVRALLAAAGVTATT